MRASDFDPVGVLFGAPWPDPFGLGSWMILLIALVMEAVLGGMPLVFRVVPHPVRVIGQAIAFFERKLNRPHRSPDVLRWRGVFLVVLLCSLSAMSGWGLSLLARTLPYGWLIEVICLVVLLSQRELFDRVRDVAKALERSLEEARMALRHVAGRDPQALDRYGVARAAIESCAENFADAVVAPAFWYLLGGLPGVFLHKTVSTLDSMIGYRSPEYRSFGWAAARLDDGLVLIPARLAGLIFVMAAIFTPKGTPWLALKTMLRDARHHASPNAGWPEGAMAGAFHFSLAGPRRYDGYMVDDPWIGNGRARLTPGDIRRGLYLYAVSCFLLIAICVLVTGSLLMQGVWP